MRRAILVITVLLATLVPAAAASATTTQVLRDCELHGRLTGHYTQKELRDALAHLPADVNEYSDCANVIRTAALNAASGGPSRGGGTPSGGGGSPSTGGGGSSPSGGGSGAPSGGSDDTGSTGGDFGGFEGYHHDPLQGASADEQAALADAKRSTGAQTVGGVPVVPGSVGSHAGATSVLPVPLIVVLALGAAALLTLAALEVRRRVRARGADQPA